MFFRPRYELKYVVSTPVAQAVAGKLVGRCNLDTHGRDGAYINESLYFDSPSFDFFYHKKEGVRLRRKVRIRRYGDDNHWEKLFVEVKKRNGQYVEKSRFTVTARLLPQLFNPDHRKTITRNLSPEAIQAYNEVISLHQLFQLRPVVFIRYKRRAFWADGDERLRVTFDSDICYDILNRDCLSPLENTQSVFDGDWIVLEVKANGSVPFWLLEVIQECECQMIRLSKYCLGVQRAYGWGGQAFAFSRKESVPYPGR